MRKIWFIAFLINKTCYDIRIQEQLRRIKRNEERDRLRTLQQNINEDGQTAVQPSSNDLAKLDALSDKPTKSVSINCVYI